MAGHHHERLAREEIEGLLERLERTAPSRECGTCECLQGFIAQLTLDAADDARPLLEGYKVDASHMHGCLGCEPCPPAEIFAEYLMRKRNG
jgi:hypothetical protein